MKGLSASLSNQTKTNNCHRGKKHKRGLIWTVIFLNWDCSILIYKSQQSRVRINTDLILGNPFSLSCFARRRVGNLALVHFFSIFRIRTTFLSFIILCYLMESNKQKANSSSFLLHKAKVRIEQGNTSGFQEATKNGIMYSKWKTQIANCIFPVHRKCIYNCYFPSIIFYLTVNFFKNSASIKC